MQKWMVIAAILLGFFFTELSYSAIGQCPTAEKDYFIVITHCTETEFVLVSEGIGKYVDENKLAKDVELAQSVYEVYQYSKKINRLIEFQLECK